MRLRKDKIIMKEKKVSSSEIDDFGSIHPKNNDLDLTFRETTIIIRHRHYSIQRGHPSMMSPTRGEGRSEVYLLKLQGGIEGSKISKNG